MVLQFRRLRRNLSRRSKKTVGRRFICAISATTCDQSSRFISASRSPANASIASIGKTSGACSLAAFNRACSCSQDADVCPEVCTWPLAQRLSERFLQTTHPEGRDASRLGLRRLARASFARPSTRHLRKRASLTNLGLASPLPDRRLSWFAQS